MSWGCVPSSVKLTIAPFCSRSSRAEDPQSLDPAQDLVGMREQGTLVGRELLRDRMPPR